jgi:hypothetical protein
MDFLEKKGRTIARPVPGYASGVAFFLINVLILAALPIFSRM